MTSKRMIIMLIACTVVFGGVFGMQFMGKKAMNQFFDNMPEPAQTISSAKAQRMQWPLEIVSVGSLSAVNGTQISSEVDGVITELLFDSGQRVKKGQRLLSIDSSQQQAELQRLQSQAQLAELNLGRILDLYKQRAVSKAEVDTAKAETQTAQAAARAQQERLAKYNIVAPFDGLLGIRQVSIGQYMGLGTKIVNLQALNPIEIEFALAEKQLAELAVGQDVKVQVDAYAEEVFSGVVSAIEPQIDPSTRLFHARARLNNPDEKLRSGMFARVVIELPGTRDVIAVPRTAIKYDPYGRSVFLVQAGKTSEGKADNEKKVASQRFVRTGVARGDYLQITEGVADGEEVVSTGLLKLRNGQVVEVNNSITPDTQLTPPQSDS